MFRFCTACLLDWARPKRQGAEAPSRSFRREARGARREARVAAQHLGTPWPTLPGGAGGGGAVGRVGPCRGGGDGARLGAWQAWCKGGGRWAGM